MDQTTTTPVRVDAQALADAVNKRLGTTHSRTYIGQVRSKYKGHAALREIILQEEEKIIKTFADHLAEARNQSEAA